MPKPVFTKAYTVAPTCQYVDMRCETAEEAMTVARSRNMNAFHWPGIGKDPVALTPLAKGTCMNCKKFVTCEKAQRHQSMEPLPPRGVEYTITMNAKSGVTTHGFGTSGSYIGASSFDMTPLAAAIEEMNETIARLAKKVAEEKAIETKMAEPPKKHRKKNYATMKRAEEPVQEEKPSSSPEKGYGMDDMSYWTGS